MPKRVHLAGMSEAALKLDDIPEAPEVEKPDEWERAFTTESRAEAEQFLAQAQKRALYAAELQRWADRLISSARKATDSDTLYIASQSLQALEQERAVSYLPHLEKIRENLIYAEKSPHAWAKSWIAVFKTFDDSCTAELEILRDVRLQITRLAADLLNRVSEPSPVFSSGKDAKAYFVSRRAK